MTTKRFSRHTSWVLCISLFVLAAHGFGAIIASASLESAWNSLSNNESQTARSEFQSAWDSEKSEEALRGLLLTAWMRGDSPAMARFLAGLIEEFPDSPYIPAYLSLCGGSEFHGWQTRDRVTTLNQALEKTHSTLHRQQIAYELTETLDMLLDETVGDAARKAGLLLEHWTVLGPFGRFGASDILHPYGPETGFRASYPGWQGEVQFKPVSDLDATGIVELSSLIQPDTGVAYALNVVESTTTTNAWLTLSSPSALQVWWNGKPVIEKAHFFLHTAKTRTVSVPVNSGTNLLVIKSLKTNPSWWVRAALQSIQPNSENQNPGDFAFHSVPFDWKEFTHTYLLPIDVALPRSDEDPLESSPYFFDLPQNTTPGAQAADRLLLASWHGDRGEYEIARRTLLEAQQIAPNFALPYSLYGDQSLRLAEERSNSKPRFHQEAEVAFRKALELDPYCQSALIGLVTYFLDRDQTDQALECLNQHLDQYPDIRTASPSNLLDYSYGILYSKKNFETEAAMALTQSLHNWTASYEAVRLLFDYYDRQKSTEQASSLLQPALMNFPAYSPFLERAGRVGVDSEIAQFSLDALHRAIRIHPDLLQYSLLLGDRLEDMGKTDEAREWYDQLLHRYPTHPRILERKAALDFLNSNPEEALATYRKAFDIAPQRMRPFRALRDAGGQNDFPYQKYDVQLDEVDISPADRWNSSRASVIYLLDIMVMDHHEDGTYDQYVHQAIKIMNQEGMQKWAEIVIPSGGNIEILKARTLSPDGTEWDVSHIQNLEGQQSLSMYGIEPGVIIDYAYIERSGRSDPGVNYSGGGYFFGSDDDPMLLSKLTVIRPETLPYHLVSNPEDFKAEATRENGKIIEVWEKRMSEGLKGERFAPPIGQRVPSLQWSTCPDWLSFVERQRLSTWGYEEQSPLIDALVNRLLSESPTKRVFVEKAYEWVRTRIEEAPGSFTTADTAVLGTGGKYQKMRMVRQLLRKAGVIAHMAHVLDRKQEGGYRPMPVLSYPGRTILIIPRQEGISERIWLDFSSRFSAVGSIDPTMPKQVAFIFDATAPYFDPVDPSIWEHGLVDRNFHFTIRKDRSAAIEGYYLYDNMYDRQIRETLTNPEIKQRLIDSQLTGELRGIQVKESDIQNLDDLTQPPRLVFSGELPEIVKPSGAQTLKISPIQVKVNASSFVSEPTRAFRMELPTSLAWDPLEIRLDLSYFLEQRIPISLPDNVFLITEFGYYSLFYQWDGNELIVRRSFLIPAQNIEPEAYGRFIEFCRTIDQSENRDIIISPPSSS